MTKYLDDGDRYAARREQRRDQYDPDFPQHDSDCALHNAPALPVGPCDCSVAFRDRVIEECALVMEHYSLEGAAALRQKLSFSEEARENGQ